MNQTITLKKVFRRLLKLFAFYVLPVILPIVGYNIYQGGNLRELEHWAAELGEPAWMLFILTLYASPLSIIVPGRVGNFFQFIVSLRRETGILITWLVTYHTVFLILAVTDFSTLRQDLVDPTSTWSWGALAGIAILIMGMTSNKFSDKVLKQLWKKIHYLAYVVLVTGMLHVAFYRDDFTEFYTVFPLYFALKTLAWKKQKTGYLFTEKSIS